MFDNKDILYIFKNNISFFFIALYVKVGFFLILVEIIISRPLNKRLKCITNKRVYQYRF